MLFHITQHFLGT